MNASNAAGSVISASLPRSEHAARARAPELAEPEGRRDDPGSWTESAAGSATAVSGVACALSPAASPPSDPETGSSPAPTLSGAAPRVTGSR